jgi:hypothetical protein
MAEPTLKDVLKAIAEMRNEMDDRFDKVDKRFDNLDKAIAELDAIWTVT